MTKEEALARLYARCQHCEETDRAFAFLADSPMNEWILFEKKLPPKGQHILVDTFGIITMGWVDSEITEELKLCIIDPVNYQVKPNVKLHDYHIKAWQPLPSRYKGE